MPGDLSALKHVFERLGHANISIIVVPYPGSNGLPPLGLRRETLKWAEARPGVLVERGNCYVVPREQPVMLRHGRFEAVAAGRAKRPICELFMSLSDELGQKSVAVLLSGTAVDAIDGLRSIRAKGGTVIVQDPATAVFDDAPRAAIAAGVADSVLAPAQIGEALARMSMQALQEAPQLLAESDFDQVDADDPTPDEPFRRVLSLLKARFHVDLSHYKLTTVRRRIERRMSLSRFADIAAYADHLRSNSEAIEQLHNDLFIHVTQFFRDPESFNALRERVFPPIVTNRSEDDPIRVWVPGCSSGEEAYSIAMDLSEFVEERGSKARLQIFATDISEIAIANARKAVYPESVVDEVGRARLQRFFERVKDGYKIRKELRDLCIMSQHDVTSHPPFANLDLISCRNVLIYFGPGLQKRIVPIFHYALKPSGFLWLGRSETPGASSNLFTLVDKQHKIYSKTPLHGARLQLPINFSSGNVFRTAARELKSEKEFQKSADQMVLFRYGPPGVVVNSHFEVLQFRGRTAPFLEPPPGQPTHSVLRMAHADVLPTLRQLLQSAKNQNLPARKEGVHVGEGTASRSINIEVAPLNPLAPERERQLLVLFEDPKRHLPAAPALKPGRSRSAVDKKRGRKDSKNHYVEQLQEELEALREHQQALIEQSESSQEELSSANEELQATNDEFHSTNEELETAKEELQSANEELTTTNDELQSRNAELISVNEKLARGEDRFRLLVEGVKDYAIYLLDTDGRVTSWNEGARRLKGYEASEIIGQHYSRFFPPEDIAANVPQMELEKARIDGRFEAEGSRIRKDGSQFWANVVVTRIHDTKGVLIGFSKVTRDLSERRRTEELLRRANESLEARVHERTADLAQALRARDEFLSIASHELRTPVTALKLLLELTSRKLGLDTTSSLARVAVSTFDRALKQAITLENLIEDLLNVSRIQSGQLELELRNVAIAKLIEDVASRLSDQLAQAGSPLKLDVEAGLVVRCDERRVMQVIVNLITNAIKYAPNSPIHITATREGPSAKIVVEDSGPGVAPENQAKLFERFERAGASANVGGLGLGLFIARRIVETHHGTIRVESQLGEGARFVVNLPVADESVPEDGGSSGGVDG
jgi:two-component system CheB/CheR fusion protein